MLSSGILNIDIIINYKQLKFNIKKKLIVRSIHAVVGVITKNYLHQTIGFWLSNTQTGQKRNAFLNLRTKTQYVNLKNSLKPTQDL